MSYARAAGFDPIIPLPDLASIPEKIAYEVDAKGVNDWMYRRPILNALPDRFAIPAAHRYVQIHSEKGRAAANGYFLDLQDNLTSSKLSLFASDDEVVSHAKEIAQKCFSYRMQIKDPQKAYEVLVSLIRNRYRINPPLIYEVEAIKNAVTVTDGKSYCTVTDTVTEKSSLSIVTLSIEGVLNRLCNEMWWRRTLRNVTIRNVEKYSIGHGLVHRNAGIYISDESMQRKQQQKRRNRRAMEKSTLVNEIGQEYNLQDLIDHSLANPSNRRAELMVRIRGTEEISKSLSHHAVLYTITAPSRMHARRFTSGNANPKYDGTTPLEAQKYLTKIWSQIRAQLAREGINYYGFRVVEPHHDGSPHWHLLIFMNKENIKPVTRVLRIYAMREDGNERGAKKHRFQFEIIDPKKGSATGYIAKYISKNIDGFGVDDDLYGKDAKNSAKRISAWASVWGIRQFQQLGGPPVTLYRELRRIQGDDLKGFALEAWEAADKGNWEKFIRLMGGPNVVRKDCPLKITRLWSDEPNIYLEPKGYQIIGVESGSVLIPTRIHQWTVKCRSEPIVRIFSAVRELGPFRGPPLAPLNRNATFFEKTISQVL